MESKRSEFFWRFFLDQKTLDEPKKYQRGLQGEHNPPSRALGPKHAQVGCPHLGGPRTASSPNKSPNIPETLG